MIIVRYLLKEISLTLIVILLALLLIIFTNQFVNYLSHAASGGLTVLAVTRLILLEVPLFLSYLLPIGLFLSVLVSLGQLYVNHEMVVLSACGFSQMQVLKWVMFLALVVSLLTAFFLFYINPKVDLYRINMTKDAKNIFSVEKLFPKRFQKLFESGWILYAGGESNGKLERVFLAKHNMANHDYPEGYWDIIKAEKLSQEEPKATGPEFALLEEGVSYRGEPGMENYQIVSFKKSAMELSLGAHSLEDKERITTDSFSVLLQNYYQDRRAAIEFNWRLSLIFAILILGVISVPLSYLRPRQGRYGNVFYALIICLVYLNAMFVSRSFVQNNDINVVLGIWWIHALMLILSIVFFGYRFGSFRKS